MKTRTIVGIAAIPLFILMVFFAPLWAFSILVGLISAGAAWELLRCVEEKMPLRFKIYALTIGFAMPVVYALAHDGATDEWVLEFYDEDQERILVESPEHPFEEIAIPGTPHTLTSKMYLELRLWLEHERQRLEEQQPVPMGEMS